MVDVEAEDRAAAMRAFEIRNHDVAYHFELSPREFEGMLLLERDGAAECGRGDFGAPIFRFRTPQS
jgi:hypothetical protein